jgi:AcrR family transcriptional regulator
MTIAERQVRDREARSRLITATARTLAAQEGWDAVTTRRLSTEIEYSQPVLSKHFASKEDIVEVVALEGFAELAESLSAARRGAAIPEEALGRVAHAFSSFAADNPTLYDAMFTRATRLRFGGTEATPARPRSAAMAGYARVVTKIASIC